MVGVNRGNPLAVGDHQPRQLGVVGLAATAFIGWLLARHGSQRLFSFALSLILGGAIGNVIDTQPQYPETVVASALWAVIALVAGVDECLEGARRIVEFCQQR